MEHFQTQKTATLLGVLAHEGGSPVGRDTLVALLWPQADQGTGRNRLNQAVSTLRKLLPGGVIGSDSQAIWIVADEVETDLDDFRAWSKSSSIPSVSPPFYRGPFLEGVNEAWAVQRRIEVQDALLTGMLRQLATHVSNEEHEEALALAGQVLALEPASPEAHLAAIRAYVSLGRHQSALDQFAHFQSVCPPEITHRQDASELVSYAERMHALGRSEPFVGIKAKLPQYNDPIMGREVELSRLTQLIMDGDRLLNIHGPVGAGKTRLAAALGARLCPYFENRVFMVDCSRVDTVEDFRRELTYVLTDGQSDDPREFDEIVMRLNPSLPLLLIVDAADHPNEPPERFMALVEAAPGATVVLISQQPLVVPGLRFALLGPLAESEGPPAHDPAVHIFLRRYELARPSYEMRPRDIGAIRQIVAAVGRLPGQIEAAATRARIMTPLEMSRELESGGDSLRLIPKVADWVLEAQEQLCASEKELLYALCLIDDAKTLADVQQLVTGVNLDTLTGLEAGGWLQAVVESDGQQRFQIPSAVRHALRNRLSPEELHSARQSWAKFCQDLAARSDAETYTTNFYQAVLDINANRSAIRETLDFFLSEGRWADLIEFAKVLGLYWRHATDPQVGVETLKSLLAREEVQAMDPETLAELRLILGGLYRMIGQARAAKVQYDAAWNVFQDSKDVQGRLRSLFGLASYYHETGDIQQERPLLMAADELAAEHDQPIMQAYARLRLGHTFDGDEDSNLARDSFVQCLILSQEAGSEAFEAAALAALSLMDLREGRYERATEQLKASLLLQDKNHDLYAMADSKLLLARAWIGMGDPDRARTLLQEVLDTNRVNYHVRANFSTVLAHFCAATGRLSEAAQVLGFLDRTVLVGRRLNVLQTEALDLLVPRLRDELGRDFETSFGLGQIMRPLDLHQFAAEILS